MSGTPLAGAPAVGFFHAGVTVSDMDRALAFYRDALGLELVSDVLIDQPYIFEIAAVAGEAIRVVFLRVPGSDAHVELLEYRGLERQPASSRPCDPGSGHFCLHTADVMAAQRRLRDAGFSTRSASAVEVTQGPRTGALIVYATDPDGYHVELFQAPPNWAA